MRDSHMREGHVRDGKQEDNWHFVPSMRDRAASRTSANNTSIGHSGDINDFPQTRVQHSISFEELAEVAKSKNKLTRAKANAAAVQVRLKHSHVHTYVHTFIHSNCMFVHVRRYTFIF